MSRFLGIGRDPQFSPGKVEADRRILELTAQCLRNDGHSAEVFVEAAAAWPQATADTVVFTMSQGRPALQRLREWELAGTRIVNRPEAILNCQRHRTVLLLVGVDVGFPRTNVIDDLGCFDLPGWIDEAGAWIKRGDVHAIHADDVQRVDTGNAARAVLTQLRDRGIERAVIQQHLPGRVVKFYGVRDGFFHACQPAGEPALAGTVLRRIDEVGRLGADALGVEVYGGDCVVGGDGAVSLIDLNDWPSYSACLPEAAQAIAAHLEKVAKS